MAYDVHAQLSARELEILERVATGATNQQIALDLSISVNTVKAHLRSVFAKLQVESRTGATRYAIQHGLISVGLPDDASGAGDARVGSSGLARTPDPRPVLWPMPLTQRIVAWLCIVGIIAAAVWPTSRPIASVGGDRLVDLARSGTSEVAEEEHSRWRPKAQLPTPRGRFAVVTVGETILVIGGLTSEGWTSRVEAYDPDADLWSRRTSKPIAVANVGAVEVNGLVYVPGGTDASSNVIDVVEVYDPRADVWSTASPMPSPRCAYAIAPYGDGFYVFGGWDGRQYLASTLYYDAITDEWREGVPMAGTRGFAAASTVADRVYIVGGYDGESESNLCLSYDPALASAGGDPWRTRTSMRVGRAGHSMAVVRDNLYVVGGGWERPFSYNERYDVANDAWSTFESPIVGEWRSLGVAMITQREGAFVYAIGGWNGSYLAVVKAYQAFYRVYLP